MSKTCDACAKRVDEVRNFYGANTCRACAKDLKEAYGDAAPHTMRSPHRGPSGISMAQAFSDFPGDDDDAGPETVLDLNNEACPGCGSMPGDGITDGCDDPLGCGTNRMHQASAIGDAIAHTQRSPMPHMKHESAKFDGDAYMEETIRLEEARKRKNKAPVTQESIGHIRQLRTQELPQNRIRIGK